MMDNFIITGFTTDITTNSSSEIFTGFQKGIDAVTEIIEEIFEWYNNLEEDEDYKYEDGNDLTIEQSLTISHMTEEKLKDLARWCVYVPLPDTGDWVVDGKYVPFDNADEIWKKYYLQQDKEERAWVEVHSHLIGTVVIESVSDNTIPWLIMDKIEETFICERRHLG